MGKNTWNKITDILSDVSDMFGLGDLTDFLLHPELHGKTKTPEEVYNDLIVEVNNRIDKGINLNNQQLAKLQSALNSLYSQVPSKAFKDKIYDVKNKITSKITTLSNNNANLESVRNAAHSNASRVLSERTSGAHNLKQQISDQNNEMVDKVQQVETKL